MSEPGGADVVVVGGGNAGLCAALSAVRAGASVLLLECAGEDDRGGNAAFSAGAMRVAYESAEDLIPLLHDVPDEVLAVTDFGSYPEAAFIGDLTRVTRGRTDPKMASTLVTRSLDTVRWLAGEGVRFQPIYGRQAFRVGGRFRFWGGLAIEAVGRGRGLIDHLYAAVTSAGVGIRYRARGTNLVTIDGRVAGVDVVTDGRSAQVPARAVILASGGFQADPGWRKLYLGNAWVDAKVCGTRYNTGDGLRAALAIGAARNGDWAGAHAVPWDVNAPPVGDLDVGDGFQKLSYPFGIMVNARGERFVDEGADFRNYTYATYGRLILEQPQRVAWQLFDQRVVHLLRDEYRIAQVSRVVSDDLDHLADRLEGVDAKGLMQTIRAFNSAIDMSVPFDPNVKDGRGTRGLTVNKSNWANPLDTPPYEAYAVGCGITSTFGGLHVTPRAEVLTTDGRVIPGLFACGEIAGGIFFHNSPGGTALTSGAVYGRIAGANAARFAER